MPEQNALVDPNLLTLATRRATIAAMEIYSIHVTTPDGTRHTLEAPAGWRVMEIIRDNDLPIKAECGGACACATCHVYVAPVWVSKLIPPSSEETMMLDDAFMVEENSRLSCQLLMSAALDGLEVTLAPNAE